MTDLINIVVGLTLFVGLCIVMAVVTRFILRVVFQREVSLAQLFNANILIWFLAYILNNAMTPIYAQLPAAVLVTFAIAILVHAFVTARNVTTLDGNRIPMTTAAGAFTLQTVLIYVPLISAAFLLGR